jgi:hypothetical protein
MGRWVVGERGLTEQHCRPVAAPLDAHHDRAAAPCAPARQVVTCAGVTEHFVLAGTAAGTLTHYLLPGLEAVNEHRHPGAALCVKGVGAFWRSSCRARRC